MANITIEEKLLSKQNSRNIIRAKLVELGLAENSAKLDALATIIDNIINQGAVSVQLREGETYTIPKGYHNGTGTVSGVAGGGDYRLEPTRTVTPTKQQQSITPANGFYGLEAVLVNAIPQTYQDVSSVTALVKEVLAGKIFVDKDGNVLAGAMVDNGAVTVVLDSTTITYTVPEGYHNGTGTVSISLEEKTVTPTKSQQKVTASARKLLGVVTIDPIPDNFIDTGDVNTPESSVLDGEQYYAGGVKKTGTMPRNGAIDASLDGINSTSVSIPAGHTSGGTVAFDDSAIVDLLDAI